MLNIPVLRLQLVYLPGVSAFLLKAVYL